MGSGSRGPVIKVPGRPMPRRAPLLRGRGDVLRIVCVLRYRTKFFFRWIDRGQLAGLPVAGVRRGRTRHEHRIDHRTRGHGKLCPIGKTGRNRPNSRAGTFGLILPARSRLKSFLKGFRWSSCSHHSCFSGDRDSEKALSSRKFWISDSRGRQ